MRRTAAVAVEPVRELQFGATVPLGAPTWNVSSPGNPACAGRCTSGDIDLAPCLSAVSRLAPRARRPCVVAVGGAV